MDVKRIAAIGECMVELNDIGDNRYRRAFAGDTLNTAVYLSRGLQGSAHRVSYVTALGEDPLSDMMVQGWQQEGIECDYVARIADKFPGLYSIQLTDDGERSFCYWRSDAAAKQMFSRGLSAKQQNSLVTDFNMLYLSGITLAILDDSSREQLFSLLKQARANGIDVVFDNNYRPRLWESPQQAQDTVNKVLEFCTMALVTFDDEQALFGDASPESTLERIADINEVVVKNGADGGLIRSGDNTLFVESQKVTNVIDTTAAGDSFNGAYLAARLRGADAREAGLYGHAMAATVIQHKGAIVPHEATASLITTPSEQQH